MIMVMMMGTKGTSILSLVRAHNDNKPSYKIFIKTSTITSILVKCSADCNLNDDNDGEDRNKSILSLVRAH